MENLSKKYTLKEEIANSITHGIGIVFSVVAVTILLVYSIRERSIASIISFSVYGFCSICLYVASTLYHSFTSERLKKLFRLFDHSSIYLFIAGTYTPVVVLSLHGYWRIILLTAVWTIAIFGIVFKVITYGKFENYKMASLLLYIAMGWLLVVAIKPMLEIVPRGFFMWLLSGGLAYTLGAILYSIKKIPYNHAIWHMFVLAGSVMHFVGIFIYLK